MRLAKTEAGWCGQLLSSALTKSHVKFAKASRGINTIS
jgi:hypothetical protein